MIVGMQPAGSEKTWKNFRQHQMNEKVCSGNMNVSRMTGTIGIGADKGPVQAALSIFESNYQIIHRPHLEQGAVGENGAEGPVQQDESFPIHFIGLNPLGENAVIAQAIPGQLKEVLCEKIGQSGHPGIGRLGNDHVIGHGAETGRTE